MQIRNLKLINFRNYKKLYLEFNPHLNLVIGQNGMGKTNLVEAIYVLALTKSFRSNNDNILINKDFHEFKINACIKNVVEDNYTYIVSNDGKKVSINENRIKRLSDYISKINVVLFSPSDLRIIKDTPSIRRKMLNIEISQLNNLYLKHLQDYNQIIKQRNSYLKTMAINGNSSHDYLDILTNKLIEVGMELNIQRKKFVDLINKDIDNLFFKITNSEGLKVVYESDYNDMTKDMLLKLYKKSYDKDLMFGKTHIGIHHDDIVFKLNDDNLKEYGSEGQQKNAIVALKLAEVNIFYEFKDNYPILILDDLFSELDNEKVNNILKLINSDVQTFITTTELDNINKNELNNYKVFEIKKDRIEEVTYE